MTKLFGLSTHSEYGSEPLVPAVESRPSLSGPRHLTHFDEIAAAAHVDLNKVNRVVRALHSFGDVVQSATYYAGFDQLIPRQRRGK